MLQAYDTMCFWLATSETNSHFLSDSVDGISRAYTKHPMGIRHKDIGKTYATN